MQSMQTPRSKSYQTSCSPVVLSSSITTHTVCLTLVNIFHRVRKDTLPRCLCKGETGKQDRFTRGQDTGNAALLVFFFFLWPWCSNWNNMQSFNHVLHDKTNSPCLTGVVLKPKSKVEERGEAAQSKEVRGRDFLFAEPSPSDHFLQHVCLSSAAARQQFRWTSRCEITV